MEILLTNLNVIKISLHCETSPGKQQRPSTSLPRAWRLLWLIILSCSKQTK